VSLLSKIKVQYHFKVLNDFSASNKFLDASNYISKINDNDIKFETAKNFIPQLFKNSNVGIDNPKIIWLNSFSYTSLELIENFLSYYFKESVQKISPSFFSYEDLIDSVVGKNNFLERITLVEWINYSYFFQWLINDESSNFKFIKNKKSFFSTPENLNFTNSNFTNCFFCIVDHPYDVYLNIKKENGNDTEISKNLFLNLDKRPEIIQTSNRTFELTNLGWAVHTQSWLDDNVQNSLKGKILNLKNLRDEPFDFFTDIIMHLIQNNNAITLNYDVIENYVKNNDFVSSSNSFDNLSNNEKKFINQQIEDVSFKLGYEL
tara:strand:+ start:400 stop:1356 length:957 start_codon:yes stop_codon:yes gene_type:complete